MRLQLSRRFRWLAIPAGRPIVLLHTQALKLVQVTTVPVSLWAFLGGQVGFMRAQGFDVHAVSSPGEYLTKFGEREEVPVYAVDMPRRITPHRDVLAVVRLYRCLRQVRPHIVHANTPKGGLLGMISATLARVPVRVYHIHGLPMMTAEGKRRLLLRWSEKISCLLAHRVFCVSHSIRNVAICEGLCDPAKIIVPLGGSVNGIDADGRFNPDSRSHPSVVEARRRCGIPDDAQVIGFVGRIVRDKGLIELITAWRELRDKFPALHLVVVGPFEPQDPVPAEVEQILRTDPRIHLVGEVEDSSPFYRAMDLVVLPTYREGFPLVPLEAASMCLPVVATRVPGCTDAVVDGVTGTLVPPYDAEALAEAIAAYLIDPELRRRHGEAGRERVLREFRQEAIWEATYQEYVRLLKERGLPAPKPRGTSAEPIRAGKATPS